ncbi:hypothetical protein PVAND_003101 [Polypedilum vanderplanki]|uniref:Uncharacterized protein n=1 Tax=Polypedilum vanderplanki TaxID=319348 RepID=A0A9J6BT29_POLVA|nr:hypothetical protein PVAND_003101 [Polypedilum vanderplanki]
MKTFAVALLLAFAVVSIECQREKEPRQYDPDREARRADARQVIHEAAKFINEQTHIGAGERMDLLKKLLKHEIDFDEVVKLIEQTPNNKNFEHDKKHQMRVKEIAEKLSKLKKDVPDYMRERYVNRERSNGSL